MSAMSSTIENTFKAAGDQGLSVRIPAIDELYLDIDTRGDYDHFIKTIALLPGVKGWTKAPSKSGYPKMHIIVTMELWVTNEERILLQACLGSDRKHELLSFLAMKQGNPHPSVFFEKI